jgi:dTDP-4-dehydrorhamnose 3,5-epimerase
MAVPTTEFTATSTSIPGLIVFDVTSVGDERGWFQEKYHKEKLIKAGMPADFQVVQNSVSYNTEPGVIRGFHAEPWDKYISVVTGEVFVAYVDLRKGPSFGKLETLTLNKNKAIFLPQGVANSFQTLTKDTYYLYSVNRHWSADKYDEYVFVNLADPQLNVAWPIALDKSIMSDRDRKHPMLRDITPMEL